MTGVHWTDLLELTSTHAMLF